MTTGGFPRPRALSGVNTLKPFRFYCQKVLPAVFDDSLSYYELLCKIAKHLGDLMETVNDINDDIQKIYECIEEICAWIEAHAEWERRIERLEAWMQALAQNALVYDVTTGLYRPSMATSRREWQAAHYYGMTVSDYAGYTVAETSGMTVRHVAVDGREFYMGAGRYEGEVPLQHGYSVPCFNPDDYIKKSDLTYIDSDNLQEHTIMGVLDSDAESDLMRPTPYMRRYTSHDLAHSWVLFNDHVIADMDADCEEGD